MSFDEIKNIHPKIRLTLTHTVASLLEPSCTCTPQQTIAFLDTQCEIKDLYRKPIDRINSYWAIAVTQKSDWTIFLYHYLFTTNVRPNQSVAGHSNHLSPQDQVSLKFGQLSPSVGIGVIRRDRFIVLCSFHCKLNIYIYNIYNLQFTILGFSLQYTGVDFRC